MYFYSRPRPTATACYLAKTGYRGRFHDNSSTDISSTTVRLQTFRLLLHTSVQDSYTSNFCFNKSLFLSIPTSTYTMIPFYQSHFHYNNATYIVSKHCGLTIQRILSVKDAYFLSIPLLVRKNSLHYSRFY